MWTFLLSMMLDTFILYSRSSWYTKYLFPNISSTEESKLYSNNLPKCSGTLRVCYQPIWWSSLSLLLLLVFIPIHKLLHIKVIIRHSNSVNIMLISTSKYIFNSADIPHVHRMSYRYALRNEYFLFLGMILDDKLNWNKHLNEITTTTKSLYQHV